jgi:phosphatidate cytidylyltransferase
MNETLKRALSGAVYIIVLLGCILHTKESLAILFGMFLVIGIFEFSKLISINRYLSLLLAAGIYVLLWNQHKNLPINHSITIFTLIVSCFLLVFLFKQNEGSFKTITKFLILLGYLIFPFVMTNYIAMGVKGYNPKILVSILILIWSNDTFAYLVGKNFGKTKLLPLVSPKKTVEGFIGGVVFTIISGILLAKFYIGANILYIWIIIAIIVSVFSTLGDLIESKFKRIAGIKDSGKIMPGHGGILDRLDSVIFVIPFINLFYLILRYVS